jgi:hypothetical protein
MIHNYSVEVYNIEKNDWEVVELARTFDEAFDKAEPYIGFSKAYDTVAILDAQGLIVWESDKPLVRMKDVGLAQQEREAFSPEDARDYVAPDGSV